MSNEGAPSDGPPRDDTANTPNGAAAKPLKAAASGARSPGQKMLAFIGNDAVVGALLWRNPVLSASLLASLSALYVLLEHVGFTALALASNVALVLILAAFLWVHGCRLFNRPRPPIPRPQLSDAQARAIAQQLQVAANAAGGLAYRVAMAEDYALFGKAVVALYVASKVAQLASLLTLLFLGSLVAFSVPAVYDHFHAQIHAAVDPLLAQASEQVKAAYKTAAAAVADKMPKKAPPPKKVD